MTLTLTVTLALSLTLTFGIVALCTSGHSERRAGTLGMAKFARFYRLTLSFP